MALKFGRKTGITSYVDGKGQVHYTEEEYDAYQNALSVEKQRRSDYDASVSSYQSALDLYENGPKKTQSATEGVKLKGKSRGKDISFEEGQDITPKETNRLLDQRIKSGELVKLSDPSIDATTRSYMSQMNSVYKSKLDGGNYDSESYVPKGTKVKGWGDIYGENFNPVEFDKASKSGKLDEYLKKNNMKEGQFFMPNISPQSKYKTPKAPGKYVENPPIKDISADQVDWKPMANMPAKKAIEVGKPPKLQITKPKAAPEKADFNAPEKIIETVNKKSMMGGAYTKGHAKRAIGQAAEEAGDRIGNAFRNPNRRYAKEEKGFKAMYGGGVNTGDTGFSDLSVDEMKSYKKDLKEVKRRSPEFRGEVKSTIKDINAASRFKKQEDAGKNVFFGSRAIIDTKTGERSSNISRTSQSLGRDYQASSNFDADRQASTFKSQTSNPANRNTVQNQLNTLSGFSDSGAPGYRNSLKAELRSATPGITNKEVRQGIRAKVSADNALVKSVNDKVKQQTKKN